MFHPTVSCTSLRISDRGADAQEQNLVQLVGDVFRTPFVLDPGNVVQRSRTRDGPRAGERRGIHEAGLRIKKAPWYFAFPTIVKSPLTRVREPSTRKPRCGSLGPTAPPPWSARKARGRRLCRAAGGRRANVWRRRAAIEAIDQVRRSKDAIAGLPAEFLDAGRGVDGVAKEDDLLLHRTHLAGHHRTAMQPGAETDRRRRTRGGRSGACCASRSMAAKQAVTLRAGGFPSSSFQVAITSSPT